MQTDPASTLTIRHATSEDLATLATLSRKTFTDKFSQLYHPEDLSAFLAESHSEAAYRHWLAAPDTLLRIAETADGTLAGYLLCGPLSLPADAALPGSLELKRLYVDAPFQGQALGSRFVEEALAWARSRQAPELYLSVFSENHGAQRLYSRYGWEKVGEFTFRVGRHEDLEFLMRLNLK